VTQNGNPNPSDRAKGKLAGKYDFAVYTDAGCTTIAKDLDGRECTGSITIKSDGTAESTLTFDKLPASEEGVNYYLKETGSNNGMAIDSTVHTISVKRGQTTSGETCTVTNNYDTGSLKIKKNVKVNGKDAASTSDFGTQDSCDGIYTFEIWKDAYKSGTRVGQLKIYFEHGVAISKKVDGQDYPCYEWVDERTTDSSGNKATAEAYVKVQKPEYGALGTYVYVSIPKQHLTYFVDGKAKMDCPVVTGNAGNHGTPRGTFRLVYKSRNQVLRGTEDNGDEYQSFVSYWMPFIGSSYGLHDASWRSEFGGNIYQGGGSHGCVNMPPSSAAQLYEMIEPGTPVLIY
jgi:lipoprotein-anchoring transpeptidase ErfK/SrfK